MHIHQGHPSKQMRAVGGGGGIYPADKVMISVHVTIIKIKSLLNHEMKVECKYDD